MQHTLYLPAEIKPVGRGVGRQALVGGEDHWAWFAVVLAFTFL